MVQQAFAYISVDSRNTYLVSVATTPQCEFDRAVIVQQNNTEQKCKHILWVYLFVLDIPEESRLINQVALLESEVLKLTCNAPAVIPPQLFRQSLTSATSKHNTNSSESNVPSTSKETPSGEVPKMTIDEIDGYVKSWQSTALTITLAIMVTYCATLM